MKKNFAVALLLLVTGIVCAQTQQIQRTQENQTTVRTETTSDDSSSSNLSYRNVSVHKIFDQKEVYIVLYAKNGNGVGQVMIPKSWAKETPSKIQFRLLPKGLNPYMTVVYKDNEFLKVILTMPSPKIGSTWAVAGDYVDIGDSAQAETLVIEY